MDFWVVFTFVLLYTHIHLAVYPLSWGGMSVKRRLWITGLYLLVAAVAAFLAWRFYFQYRY